MILDVDFLIDFFKKHTNEDSKGEMGEQDAPAAASAPSGNTEVLRTKFFTIGYRTATALMILVKYNLITSQLMRTHIEELPFMLIVI